MERGDRLSRIVTATIPADEREKLEEIKSETSARHTLTSLLGYGEGSRAEPQNKQEPFTQLKQLPEELEEHKKKLVEGDVIFLHGEGPDADKTVIDYGEL